MFSLQILSARESAKTAENNRTDVQHQLAAISIREKEMQRKLKLGDFKQLYFDHIPED